jgi:hypothetical protein
MKTVLLPNAENVTLRVNAILRPGDTLRLYPGQWMAAGEERYDAMLPNDAQEIFVYWAELVFAKDDSIVPFVTILNSLGDPLKILQATRVPAVPDYQI